MIVALAIFGISSSSAASLSPVQLVARNNTDLGDFLSNPNPDVSGRVNMPGFRLDTTYPGAGGTKPWSLELNITRWAESSMSPGNNATRVSAQIIPPSPGEPGAVLTSNGSFAASEDVRKSWSVSIFGFGAVGPHGFNLDFLQTVPEGNDEEKGTCPESVFSDQCKDELRSNIAINRQVTAGTGPPSGVEIPESCEGYKHTYIKRVNLTDHFSSSSTMYWESPSDMDVPGEAYDILGAKTWPIIVVWGHGNQTNERLRDDQVTFACVKADRHHGPAEMHTGAGPRVVSSGNRGLYVVACVLVVVTQVLL